MPLIDEDKPEFVTEMANDRSNTGNLNSGSSTAPAPNGSGTPTTASSATASTAFAEPTLFASSSPTRNRTLASPIRFRTRTRRPSLLFVSPTDSEDDAHVLPSATSISPVISIHSNMYVNDDDEGGTAQQRQSESASRRFGVIIDDDEDDDFYRGPRYNDFRVTSMEIDSINHTADEEDDYEDEDVSVNNSVSTLPSLPSTLRSQTSQRIRAFTPLGSSSRFIPSQPSSSTSTSTSTSPVRGTMSIGSRFSPGRRHYTFIPRYSPEIKTPEEDELNGLLRGDDDSSETQMPFRLPTSSFVHSGMQFNGTQNLMNSPNEEWKVKVSFHHVDFKSLSLFGLMEAMNVPHVAHNVITYWEGEIIDFAKYNLWTNKWKANVDTDLQHWGKFEAFRNLDVERIMRGGRTAQKCIKWLSQKYIFMRWKERCFVNISAQDSGLTIAGFYYICMRRSDGHIEGYYFDRDCTLYQKLMLTPWTEAHGFSFSQASFR